MARTLKTSIRPTLTWEYRDERDLSTVRDDNSLALTKVLTSGIGSDQASSMFNDRRIITPSTSLDLLDLSGGLVDVFGNTLVFTTIKVMLIRNLGIRDGSGGHTETAGEDLLIGQAVSNPWITWVADDADAQVRVDSGGVLLLSSPLDGFAVTAGTGDILQIEHIGSVGDIEYDIVLIGTT